MKLKWILLYLSLSYSSAAFCIQPQKFDGTNLETITIDKPALYPEGIDYNPKSDKFIVGSFRDGGVYEIGLDGSYHQIVNDERLNSVFAVRVDVERDRLLVVNSDIGSNLNPYAEGPKKLASLGIYELSTGKNIDFINLGQLLPNKKHLANGMTLDSEGNAYVTDSFSPVIYKIDTKGNASVFLESDKFVGEGINLNGIVYHPDGYLITVKKGEGVLFKVPLDNPQQLSMIESSDKFVGGDGLVLVNNNKLIVIANRAAGETTETVFSLESADDWQTAEVKKAVKFGKVCLTTGTMRKGKLYVMHSNIKELVAAPEDEKNKLDIKATIQQVLSQ